MTACNPAKSREVCGNEAVCVPDQNNSKLGQCFCPQTSTPLPAGSKICSLRPPTNNEAVFSVQMPANHQSSNSNGSVVAQISLNSTSNHSINGSVPLWSPSNPMSVYLSMIMAVLSVIIVIFIVTWKIKSQRIWFGRRKADKHKAIAIQLEKNILIEERYTTNPQYTSASATTDISVGLVPLLSRNSIIDLKKIGEGFFGKVYRGQLHTVDNGEEHVETVAVKMLKQTANLQAEEDFMREVEIMSSFHHPNILILIGVCPRENSSPPWMIFEFMPFGDLADVLRNSSHQFWKSVPALPNLSSEALLSIASQIADGMEYLAAQRFVHRDLACRNCLVGSALTVKISDFGMSRDVYTCDYYKIGGTRMLPVRWMSPESILYGKFTLESDIWSYGVVLWEIYSYGKQPYFGHTNDEVLKFILEGIFLDIPENCPTEIAQVMKLCWRKDPKERIQFLDICNQLSKLKEIISQRAISSLPRPPPVPITIDYPMRFEDETEDNLDEDNYLKPKSPPSNSNSSLNGYLETLP